MDKIGQFLSFTRKSTKTKRNMRKTALILGLFYPAFAWGISLGQVVNYALDVGTFNPVSWAATFLIACAVNVSLEGAVYKYAFRLVSL